MIPASWVYIHSDHSDVDLDFESSAPWFEAGFAYFATLTNSLMSRRNGGNKGCENKGKREESKDTIRIFEYK